MPYKNAVLDDKELQAGLSSINPKFGDLCTRAAGEVWGLPLISQKLKALITIAIDVVNQDHVGPGNPFGAHVNMAMMQGSNRDEIEEVLLFTCVYAGFNKAAGAFGALNEVLGPPADSLPAGGLSYDNKSLDDTSIQEDLAKLDPQFGGIFYKLATEVWGQPIISIKDKAFIAMAIDVVNQGKTVGAVDPFDAHVNIACKHGATRKEVEELITFTCVYAGFNKGVSFFASLSDIFPS